MTTMKCPQCGKDIDLVGQKELTEEYGLSPNPVASLRAQGVFPEPVLNFGNRLMWLRRDIEVFSDVRAKQRIEKLLEDVERTLAALPETERGEARKMLVERGAPRKGR